MLIRLVGEVVDNLEEAIRRAVGEADSVPKVATPEMLTAGPTGSLTGASRSLSVNWPRVSLTVTGVSVAMLLTVMLWSRSCRPAAALV